jgi:hypothetical protein
MKDGSLVGRWTLFFSSWRELAAEADPPVPLDSKRNVQRPTSNVQCSSSSRIRDAAPLI